MPRPLVLASTSPYRRALLERLGLSFRAVAPEVNENAFKSIGLEPVELAQTLAKAKALSVAEREPGSVIIGSDQVAAFDGRVFDKPGDRERAIAQLLAMSGRTHELITAMAVVAEGELLDHTDRTLLTFRNLTRDEIERYVSAEQPYDCAGSYRLEARGIALFDRIESADHTAVMGLPLMALVGILRGLGYAIP